MVEFVSEPGRAGLSWRPRVLKIYLVAASVWLSWFGYAAYDANRQIGRAQEFLHASDAEKRSGHPISYNQDDVAVWLTDQTDRRSRALRSLPVFPIGVPVLYLIGMRIFVGLRRLQKA